MRREDTGMEEKTEAGIQVMCLYPATPRIASGHQKLGERWGRTLPHSSQNEHPLIYDVDPPELRADRFLLF